MICKTCNFETDRLLVSDWHSDLSTRAMNQSLAGVLKEILTPPVTESLPDAWRGEYTTERASRWIASRDRDGATLLAIDRSSQTPVGLLILFEVDDGKLGRMVRVGYLLAESAWGRGLASELLGGFVGWCKTAEITSIVGGVERDNIASRRVLEKNGFTRSSGTENQADLIYELKL